jgi:hypothetical protein
LNQHVGERVHQEHSPHADLFDPNNRAQLNFLS